MPEGNTTKFVGNGKMFWVVFVGNSKMFWAVFVGNGKMFRVSLP